MSENREPASGQDSQTRNIGGRPSTYTQETADTLCAYLSMGESLRTACRHEGMPDVKTVFNWFRLHKGFLQQYTRAKEEAADALAEEILDISDDATNDYMEIHDTDENSSYKLNGEHIQRSRLRVESRKWLMAKMKPKRYGDHTDITSGGESLVQPLKPEQIDQLLKLRAKRESNSR